MSMMSDQEGAAAEMFERSVVRAMPGIAVAPETEVHEPFLTELFVACSPWRGMLPETMLRQQADMQRIGHRSEYPDADRRILSVEGVAIGRCVIDWSAPEILLVDIAILPERQGGGIGSTVIGAMTAVADAIGRPVSLSVFRDNPAARLYLRHGFVFCADDGDPFLGMLRPAQG